MAIPVNPVDQSGLSALANNRASYLNLPVSAYDPSGLYKPLFEASKAQFDARNQQQLLAMQGQNQLANTNLNNQAQLQYGQQQNAFNAGQNTADRAQALQIANNTNQLGQAQLSSENAYKQGLLQQGQQDIGIRQGQLGVNALQAQNQGQYQQGLLSTDNQRVQLEAQNQAIMKTTMQLRAMSLLHKDDVQKLGGYAGAAITAYQQDPANFSQRLPNILTSAVQDNVMTQDQAAQMLQLPQQQQLDLLHAYAMSSSVALKLQNTQQQGGLDKSVAGKYTQQLDNTQILHNQLQSKIAQIQANPDQYNQILGQPGITSNIVGPAESLSGIGNGPGSYADMRAQRATFFEDSKDLAARYAQSLGALPSSRTVTLGTSQLPTPTNTFDAQTALTKYQAMDDHVMKAAHIYAGSLAGSKPITADIVDSTFANNPSTSPNSNTSLAYKGKTLSNQDVEDTISYNMKKYPQQFPTRDSVIQQLKGS